MDDNVPLGLSEDMYEDGYKSIANIDISKVVVEQMISKLGDKSGLTWKQMDATALDFPDENFDAVIIKGTMDAILCGEGSTTNVAKMCAEISRVMKPNSVFVVVSYGIPENRLSYLENTEYNWKVEVVTVPKPTVSAASVPESKDANSVHYIYVCTKGVRVKDEDEDYDDDA